MGVPRAFPCIACPTISRRTSRRSDHRRRLGLQTFVAPFVRSQAKLFGGLLRGSHSASCEPDTLLDRLIRRCADSIYAWSETRGKTNEDNKNEYKKNTGLMLDPDNWLTATTTKMDAFGTEPIVRPLRTPGVKHALPGPSKLADDREQQHHQTFAKWRLHDPLSGEELAQGGVERFGDFGTKRCLCRRLLSDWQLVRSLQSAPPRPAAEATVIVYSNSKVFQGRQRCPRAFSAPGDASRPTQVFGEHAKIPFTDVFTCLLGDDDEKNKTFEEVQEEVHLDNFWCDRDGVQRFGDFSTKCCSWGQLISGCQVIEDVIERHRDYSPDCSFVQSQQSTPPLPAIQVTVSVISDLIDFLGHKRCTRTSSAADDVSRPIQIDEERANLSFTEVLTSLICDDGMETKTFDEVQEKADVLVWCHWEADIPREILLKLQPKKTTLLAFQKTDPLPELSKNVTYPEERRFYTFRNGSHEALVPDVRLAQGPSAHEMAPLLHGSVATQRSGGSLDHWRVKPSLRVEVPCAFCGMEVCAWKPGDERLREHACHCSYFPLLQNPKLPGEYNNSGHDVQVALGVQLSKLGVKMVVGPKHPSRTSPDARMRSFDKWPSTSPRRPNELVNAGFFYIGLHDYTKCFHCDGGLCNWDASDDPWEEHARWFPRCQFVLLSKGEAYIDQCLRRHRSHLNSVAALTSTGGFNEDEGTTTELEALMRSDDVQFCLSQGVPVETLRVALLQHMRDQSRGLASRDELLQVLRDLPGLPRSSNGRTAVEQSSPGGNTITPPSPPSLPEKLPGRKMKAAARGSASSPLPSELSALAQENLRLKEQGLCKVCLDSEVAVVFLPCGHLVACPACASALTKCPVCRTAIGAAVRTLLSS